MERDTISLKITQVKKNKPLVSVVIPCFNDGNNLLKCIDSILTQSYQNLEIILIDDGSDLKTKKVIRNLNSKIDILIEQKNKGQSSARNEGIKVANGSIICLVDSDDSIENDFIEQCINNFNDGVKIVGSWLNIIGDDKKSRRIFKPKGGCLRDFLFKNAISGAGILFLKKDAILIGGYDETMIKGWEDWDFNLRLMKLGGRAIVVKKPLYNYYKRKNSTTSNANSNRLELLKFMYLKHADIYQSNFDEFACHVHMYYSKLNREKIIIKNSLEFKLGSILMKPLRKIKRTLIK